jgi:hypothetical protein
MYAGKISGDNRVKGPDYRELPAVFLGKIAKGKKFYLHIKNSMPRLWTMTQQESSQKVASAKDAKALYGLYFSLLLLNLLTAVQQL